MSTKVAKPRILFSNYDVNDRIDYVASWLLDTLGDENGWNTVEDIPEQTLWDEVHDCEEVDWDLFSRELSSFIESHGPILVVGTVGRWNGNFAGGKVCHTLADLATSWRDCDYIEFTDCNGHLHLRCSHHDGTNNFEIRCVSNMGMAFLEKHEEDWDLTTQEIHERMMASNKLTSLPHFAHRVYGMRKTEYVPASKSTYFD